ncbi:hypothetical protein EDD17DRAFT_1503993 [Pisolithus thermaeus]|nr:hypothetical protein EV401DRAFT_1896369 [Pisolithus croceorrhizus]KAI6167777.1 hypothetical protein EDD17DRAFT_1503993 [Pisolithus thermaeus]
MSLLVLLSSLKMLFVMSTESCDGSLTMRQSWFWLGWIGSFLFLPSPLSFHIVSFLLLRDIPATVVHFHTDCTLLTSRLKHHKLSFHNYSFHKPGLPLHSPPAGPAEGWKIPALPCHLSLKGVQMIGVHMGAEMSVLKIDILCYLWGHSSNGGQPPFSDHKELYKTINAMELKYNGEQPANNIPPWMDEAYEYWFHNPLSLVENILTNSELHGEFDYSPYWDFTTGDSKQRLENFMSGDWAWSQVDAIARDSSTHGATFIPIILGSDKTMVLAAIRQNDYWPVYLSVGSIHNNVQHAHCSGVKLLAFLVIPKGSASFPSHHILTGIFLAAKKYTDDPMFWHFKKQLFHIAMSKIPGSLKACMMVPWVMKCPDGHFHHVICSIGLYIADYPEQVLISRIVQNWCDRWAPHMAQLMRVLIEELQASAAWDKWGIGANIVPFTKDFPCANIWQLVVPDTFHQLIKGDFKDHLMEWDWLADIDHHNATAPPFPGLWRFPDGQGFSQWTGNDSKALMKYVM